MPLTHHSRSTLSPRLLILEIVVKRPIDAVVLIYSCPFV